MKIKIILFLCDFTSVNILVFGQVPADQVPPTVETAPIGAPSSLGVEQDPM